MKLTEKQREEWQNWSIMDTILDNDFVSRLSRIEGALAVMKEQRRSNLLRDHRLGVPDLTLYAIDLLQAFEAMKEHKFKMPNTNAL